MLPELKLLEDNTREVEPTEMVSNCTKTSLEARGRWARKGLIGLPGKDGYLVTGNENWCS